MVKQTLKRSLLALQLDEKSGGYIIKELIRDD